MSYIGEAEEPDPQAYEHAADPPRLRQGSRVMRTIKIGEAVERRYIINRIVKVNTKKNTVLAEVCIDYSDVRSKT